MLKWPLSLSLSGNAVHMRRCTGHLGEYLWEYMGEYLEEYLGVYLGEYLGEYLGKKALHSPTFPHEKPWENTNNGRGKMSVTWWEFKNLEPCTDPHSPMPPADHCIGGAGGVRHAPWLGTTVPGAACAVAWHGVPPRRSLLGTTVPYAYCAVA